MLTMQRSNDYLIIGNESGKVRLYCKESLNIDKGIEKLIALVDDVSFDNIRRMADTLNGINTTKEDEVAKAAPAIRLGSMSLRNLLFFVVNAWANSIPEERVIEIVDAAASPVLSRAIKGLMLTYGEIFDGVETVTERRLLESKSFADNTLVRTSLALAVADDLRAFASFALTKNAKEHIGMMMTSASVFNNINISTVMHVFSQTVSNGNLDKRTTSSKAIDTLKKVIHDAYVNRHNPDADTAKDAKMVVKTTMSELRKHLPIKSILTRKVYKASDAERKAIIVAMFQDMASNFPIDEAYTTKMANLKKAIEEEHNRAAEDIAKIDADFIKSKGEKEELTMELKDADGNVLAEQAIN